MPKLYVLSSRTGHKYAQ